MFIVDWKEVLLKAYSVWFAIVGLFMVHASDILFEYYEIDTNPESWTYILSWLFIAVVVSRFIPQTKKHKWKRRGCVIMFILALCAFNVPSMADECEAEPPDVIETTVNLISRWEGKENTAYLDIVGVPTICYGHTRTVTASMVDIGLSFTDEKCTELLLDEVIEYRVGVQNYFNDTTKRHRLTAHRDAAYTSLAYNVGIRAAGKSTATRRINRGDIKGGCEAITWWNRAGNRVVRGLVNRRKHEFDFCMKGLS